MGRDAAQPRPYKQQNKFGQVQFSFAGAVLACLGEVRLNRSVRLPPPPLKRHLPQIPIWIL